MYDAVIGRWTSIDPFGEFWSPYVAFGNNPINFNDPSGGMTGDPPAVQGIGAESIQIGELPSFDASTIQNVDFNIPSVVNAYLAFSGEQSEGRNRINSM